MNLFSALRIVSLSAGLLMLPSLIFAQQEGEPIEFINNTPTFDEANLQAITPSPVLLARSSDEDREPKVSVLNNGTTIVFWVNRSGSHHFSGVDSAGNRLFPIFEDTGDIDIIVGENTGVNTNWTLNKADRVGGGFMVAATYQGSTVSGIDTILPASVVDADGFRIDDGQGHGLFKIFNADLEPVTEEPVSVGQFSAGHREWDCCWLNDGKLVIGTVCRDHRYEADPDYPDGGNTVATINIFNPDGSRFRDEFFVGDLIGQQRNVRLGALGNGFVCIYDDDKSTVGGTSLQKGIIYDNNGNVLHEFTVTDEENGLNIAWMNGGGATRFVTVTQASLPEGLDFPEDIAFQTVLLGQVWNDQGERITPYILLTQFDDFRNVDRPRAAMARNGSFAFSWIDDLSDDFDFSESVIGRIFNAAGTPATNMFVTHPLPEFTVPDSDPPLTTGGGDPGEPIVGMNNEYVAYAWGTRAAPDGQARDIALMVFQNPAEGTGVSQWELY